MEFTELREDEYEAFVSSHELGNFLQSAAIARHRAASGWQPYFVGVKDKNGTIIATALLTSRSVFGQLHLFECLQGPIMNYDDEALVGFFFTNLRTFLKDHNALRLRLNPPLLLHRRDSHANISDENYDGHKYIGLLQLQGLLHLKMERVDNDPMMIRWYATKDMRPYHTEEEVMNGLDQKSRWSVRKTLKSGIRVRVLPHDQLDVFYDVILHTATRREFSVRDKQYYASLAQRFGPDHIQFCVAELDTEKYQVYVQAELEKAKTDLTSLSHSSKQNPGYIPLQKRLRAAKEATAHFETKLATAKQLQKDGKVLIMAAAVFIHYAGELVYLSGGSYEQYLSFGAPYALQWYAQTYALTRRIPRYNFYGTKGTFSGHPDQHGVYRFKKGLGAIVEEQIGYFDMYPRPIFSSLHKILSEKRSRQNATTKPIHTVKSIYGHGSTQQSS